jgi:UDP-GlcNAc:undecaprenyl-phosphate/decaprenyl-phosphate GlcNAc-1-phosphate transferase
MNMSSISGGEFTTISTFTLSFLISSAIIALGLAGRLTVAEPSRSANVQNIHRIGVARTGGVAIFASLCCAIALSPSAMEIWYGHLLFAASPVFIAGLAEDIGLNISPRNRLAASLASGIVCVVLLGAWLPRTDLAPIDHYIELWWIGAPITIVITAGFANAFNMIDGLHGLALGVASIAAASLMIIAEQSGDEAVQHLMLLLLLSMLGMFVFNFPRGLIFLGDAGAYTLGFLLSWVGIILQLGSDEVSFWAIILIMLLPSCDMLLSIFRRLSAKKGTSRADRMHLHHVVFRVLKVVLMRSSLSKHANPLATVCLMPFAIVPALWGVFFWDDATASFFGAVLLSLLYCIFYFGMVRLLQARKFPVLHKRRLGRGVTDRLAPPA